MADSKKNIIVKSRELFEQYGYQKTTLTDIAKSLGKVKSAIYYYFSGKEEIFAELVKVEAADFLEKLTTEVKKETTPIAQLESYVNTRVDLMEKVAKKYHFLKKEFFELIPIVEENRIECDAAEVMFLTQILQENKVDDPSFKANLLMQSLKGLEVQMYVTDKVQSHVKDRNAFVNFMLNGVLSNLKS